MPKSATGDAHTKEGQAAKAARIEDAINRLERGEESDEPSSIREKLDHAAAEFKAKHQK